MKILLTSIGILGVRENGVKVDANINEDNGFIDTIKNNLMRTGTFVFVSSDPTEYEHNDHSCKLNVNAFKKIGINFKKYIVVDDRNANNLENIFSDADMIFLQGGDVYVQNQFFAKINLKKYLTKTDALIIAQSAGSMNLSNIVYIYPEDDTQLDYPKYIYGMGFTDVTIIPHFNVDKGCDYIPDTINLIDDYFKPDSKYMTLYAIPDGTYIAVVDNNTTIYGECYMINNGIISKACDKNKSIKLL